MFDIDQLVADCRACLTEAEPRRAIKETLTRAVADPSSITAVLPPDVAGITLHHQSDDLTVLEAVWAPGMRLYPHDHQMWACIGIYAGQEDNEFFRRPPDRRPGLVESGGKQLRVGDVIAAGRRHHPRRHQPARRADRRDPRLRRRLREPAPEPVARAGPGRSGLRPRPHPPGVRRRQRGLAGRYGPGDGGVMSNPDPDPEITMIDAIARTARRRVRPRLLGAQRKAAVWLLRRRARSRRRGGPDLLPFRGRERSR